ncbi:MAG: glycosyltransferase [Paludibacteraceae bacterium]|nr:glycosyltransferase [Paludibacteraceae bacterium]
MEISVIVPLYNAEKYIEECLNSLLAQTIIGHTEVIVVDDHGEDGSVDIVKRIIAEHQYGKHIKLISTTQNGGAWAARNIGLELARGQYIGFCDADDWVEPDMYERLYREAESREADWAYCLGQKDYEGGEESEVLEQEIDESCVMKDEVKKKMFVNGISYFWTAIYSRTFLKTNHIRFPEGKFAEDSYFWWMAVMYSRRLGVVNSVGYHYRIQPDSISQRPDEQKAEIKQMIYSKLIKYFKGKGLYRLYQRELDWLYIRKGFLVPLEIEAVAKEKPDFKSIWKKRSEDEVSLNNIYLMRDFGTFVRIWAFRLFPNLMIKILRKEYEKK